MISPNTGDRQDQGPLRGAFTLTELLVVIMVILLLASMVLFAMAGVQEEARARRTSAQIARLHELLMERWESYLTRRVPLKVTPSNPRQAARARLLGLRELMRYELPDRVTDVLGNGEPQFLATIPSAHLAFRRLAAVAEQSTAGRWTPEHQGAECLYMIASRTRLGNASGLEFFSQSEIGDVDNDGMPEILDGWGTPIRLLRWPAGFESPIQDRFTANGRDVFDPTGVFPENFTIYPLIISAGPDQLFDVSFDGADEPINYHAFDSNPYSTFGGIGQLGVVIDANNDGQDNSIDNIHNHILAVN